jgi:RNA-directed DNA polymerase
MITGLAQEVLATDVNPLVRACLQERGVTLAPEPTTLTPIADGCACRGQHGRQDNGQFLTRPSKTNGHTFLTDSHKVIQDHKPAPASWLITPRPKARGAKAHPHAAATATLVHGDPALGNALGRGARRRHPQQPMRWLAHRSVGPVGNQPGRCFGPAKAQKGHPSHPWRCLASAPPGTRHSKIKGACNPDDPAWTIALEARLGVQRDQTRRGQRPLRHRWQDPGGNGPVCAQPSTTMTGGHPHHIV